MDASGVVGEGVGDWRARGWGGVPGECWRLDSPLTRRLSRDTYQLS